jgi:Uma2 family endonuclease
MLEELAALRDEGRRVELVDGEIVEKASPSPEHGDAQIGLGDALGPMRGRGGGGRPGGWWLMTEVEVEYERGQCYRHDAVGWRRERSATRPAGTPVVLRPDWVCEILSPSTARNDLVVKLRGLHRAGVPHYWIVDPEHRTLTVLRHAPDAYLTVLTAAQGDVVRAEPFEAIEIDLARLLGVGD